MSETITEAPAVDTEAPATEPAQAVDWEARFKESQEHSRKWEERSKANKDAADRLSALEEASKTEAQKVADRAEQAEKASLADRAELARMKAAVKFGLSEDDLDLLGTHGTADEIAARAEKLAKRLKAADAAKAKPNFGGGDRGGDVAAKAGQLSVDDVKKMYAEKRYGDIEKARQEGRLTTALSGK
jgi:predicted DNA binding CopG/RHH family protein